MSENQALTLQKLIDEQRPNDDKAMTEMIGRMVKQQDRPHFVVWWDAYTVEGEPIKTIQEAEVLMSDWSVLRVELTDEHDGLSIQAAPATAHNLRRFTRSALASDSASRVSDEHTFEGDWYSALDDLGQSWLEQMQREQEHAEAA